MAIGDTGTNPGNIAEKIHDLIDNMIMNVNTCIPGQIESFDLAKKQASVRPLVNKVMNNGDVLSSLKIDNVPVIFPTSKNFSLDFDLVKGDKGLIFFAQTGIGNYLSGDGQEVDADDPSMHSMTDAIFIPGLWPFGGLPETKSKIYVDSSNNINVENENGFFKILEDGTIEINGNADFAVKYNELKTAFDTLKNDFNSFISIYNAHIHPVAGVTAGPATVPSSVTVSTGTPTTADMTSSKVDEVKLP